MKKNFGRMPRKKKFGKISPKHNNFDISCKKSLKFYFYNGKQINFNIRLNNGEVSPE